MGRKKAERLITDPLRLSRNPEDSDGRTIMGFRWVDGRSEWGEMGRNRVHVCPLRGCAQRDAGAQPAPSVSRATLP
eukprot:2933110-Prymnesium_polylepis.1